MQVIKTVREGSYYHGDSFSGLPSLAFQSFVSMKIAVIYIHTALLCLDICPFSPCPHAEGLALSAGGVMMIGGGKSYGSFCLEL